MTTTHLPTLATFDNSPEAAGDVGWAAAELGELIQRVGAGSVAGMILRLAQRELRSVAAEPARGYGPARAAA